MITMKCPICRKPAQKPSPDFPFCGERCRLIDLGNWSAEKYVISSPARPGDMLPDESSEQEDQLE